MSPEEILKSCILNRYRSIKQFCTEAGIPYTTVDNMLKRGLNRSGVSTVLKVCTFLNISIEELMNGNIVAYTKSTDSAVSSHEKKILSAYREHPEMQPAIDRLLNADNSVNYQPSNLSSEICVPDGLIDNINAVRKLKKNH